MRKTIPIPKNEKYTLPDFIHRLTYGIGIKERVDEEVIRIIEEATRKAEEATREAEAETRIIEAETRKAEARIILAVKHFAKLGLKPIEIAQLLGFPIDKVLEFIKDQ